MSEESKENVSQHGEGSIVVQALGTLSQAIVNLIIPASETVLIAELATAIVVQILGYASTICAGELALCCWGILGVVFPLTFGIPAIQGLLLGIQEKERRLRAKLILLSLVSGTCSMLPWLILFGMTFLVILVAMIQKVFGLDDGVRQLYQQMLTPTPMP